MKKKINVKKFIVKKIEYKNHHKNLNKVNDRNKIRICSEIRCSGSVLTSYNNSQLLQRVGQHTDSFIYSPILEDKKPISIIITAYKSQNFIEDCLNSIEKQTYFNDNNNYEILIGIDCCNDTLVKVNEIRHKYRNLKVYMMKNNKGTYVTTNTLLKLAKYDNLIRFDSDDIMTPYLINEIMSYSENYDIIKFKYIDYIDSLKKIKGGLRPNAANGAIYFKKNVFEISGGYLPWKTAADFEFIERLKNFVKIYTIDNFLFYRRVHSEQITTNNIELRQELINQIPEEYMINEIKIRCITNKYDEV
jgi:glycosyltransferase involved in cell wall biosynthesis